MKWLGIVRTAFNEQRLDDALDACEKALAGFVGFNPGLIVSLLYKASIKVEMREASDDVRNTMSITSSTLQNAAKKAKEDGIRDISFFEEYDKFLIAFKSVLAISVEKIYDQEEEDRENTHRMSLKICASCRDLDDQLRSAYRATGEIELFLMDDQDVEMKLGQTGCRAFFFDYATADSYYFWGKIFGIKAYSHRVRVGRQDIQALVQGSSHLFTAKLLAAQGSASADKSTSPFWCFHKQITECSLLRGQVPEEKLEALISSWEKNQPIACRRAYDDICSHIEENVPIALRETSRLMNISGFWEALQNLSPDICRPLWVSMLYRTAMALKNE